MFEKELMESTFLSLVGYGCDQRKPFECVGTFAEARAAVELSVLRYLIYRDRGRDRERAADARHIDTILDNLSTTNLKDTVYSSDVNTELKLPQVIDVPHVLRNIYCSVEKTASEDLNAALITLSEEYSLRGEQSLVEHIYRKWNLG